MRSLIKTVFITLLFTFGAHRAVFAGVVFDDSKASSGIVGITYDGGLSTTIKAVVDKDGTKYIYTVKNNNKNYVPLQLGTGSYTISVMENVGGSKYKPLDSTTISANSINESAMYLHTNFLVDYAVSTRAIPYFKGVSGGKSGKALFTSIYDDVVKNYSYDFDKAASVAKDYTPVIDRTFGEKKGICFDYAALVGGALRAQGLPTRLVMGYAPDISVYHAWNQVLLDGKWETIDTTADAQYLKAKQKVPMIKKSSEYKVVKIY